MSQQNQHSRARDIADDVILSVREASVTFNSEDGESRVLDNVSFDVKRGEVLGVVGESGSGKSMFASSLLNAVEQPGQVSGEVIYNPTDGEPVDLLSLPESELRTIHWEELSFAIQAAQSAFNPTMKVGEHFAETLRAHDADVEAGMERAREMMRDLYLDPDLVFDSYGQDLSGGMNQRALLALSLVLEPEVLVMDEPTSSLDLLMQRSIISLLSDIREKYDLTMVFVTHDLPLVSDIADRLAVMYAFEFAEVGPTDEMIENPTHPYTRALLNSVPSLSKSYDESTSIPGTSPAAMDVPSGCSYHPRCPLATDECTQMNPELSLSTENHHVACHHWEDVADEIPLSYAERLEAEQ